MISINCAPNKLKLVSTTRLILKFFLYFARIFFRIVWPDLTKNGSTELNYFFTKAVPTIISLYIYTSLIPIRYYYEKP